MSNVLNYSCLRAGRQSITNPTKSVRQNHTHLPSGRSVSSSFTSPNLRSPKLGADTYRKMATVTPLDISKAAISGLFRPEIHSSRNHGRSISLFLPSSSVVYDVAYGATRRDSNSSFSQVMTCASPASPTHATVTAVPATNMPSKLALLTPLPLSPILATEIDDAPAPMGIMTEVFQSQPGILSPPPSERKGHRLPSIRLVTSKSMSLSSTISASTIPSPTARARRTPSPSRTPPMHITPSDSKYVLNVQLPTEIQREMVTVSAKKGDRIAIVADAWHMEEDCHYEWQICFSPYDINMTSIRVILDDDAQLTIHVERRSPNILSMF